MKQIAEILGENLARERKLRGLSQASVAESLGVQGITVNRWENQKTWPTPENVEAVAKLYGIPSWTLYVPHKPQKQTKTAAPDPKLREAVSIICSALGFSLARPRASSLS